MDFSFGGFDDFETPALTLPELQRRWTQDQAEKLAEQETEYEKTAQASDESSIASAEQPEETVQSSSKGFDRASVDSTRQPSLRRLKHEQPVLKRGASKHAKAEDVSESEPDPEPEPPLPPPLPPPFCWSPNPLESTTAK